MVKRRPVYFLMAFLLLATSTTASTAFAKAPAPEVFSGTLYHEALKIHQLVRVYFFRTRAPSASGASTTISALVTMHLGSYDSYEYTSFFYNQVAHHAGSGEYLLQKNEQPKGRRLPLIHLRMKGDELTGDFDTPDFGAIGHLKLYRGWEPKLAKGTRLLRTMAGKYVAVEACRSFVDGDTMVLDRIELVPARIFASDHLGSSGPLLANNYMGSTVCIRGDDERHCGNIASGTYFFYTNRFMLQEGRFQWNCAAIGENLRCESPQFMDCLFVRYRGEHEPAHSRPPSPTVAYVEKHSHVAHVKPAFDDKDCDNWQGNYHGVLRHQRHGSLQHVRLKLATIMTEGPTPKAKCAISGVANLHFGANPESRERIGYTFNQVDFIPSEAEQTFIADKDTDAVLRVSRNADGSLDGSWFSKLYGYVGTFRLERGETPPFVKGKFIRPIAGKYERHDMSHFHMYLNTTPMWPNPESYDPANQISILGWREYLPGQAVHEIPLQRTDTIEQASYDYFTNFLVLRTGSSLMAGQVYEHGLHLKAYGRSFNSFVVDEDLKHFYHAFD